MKKDKEPIYTFTNCEGKQVSFPAPATIEDVMKAGVLDIWMEPKGNPPSKDKRVYVHTP